MVGVPVIMQVQFQQSKSNKNLEEPQIQLYCAEKGRDSTDGGVVRGRRCDHAVTS